MAIKREQIVNNEAETNNLTSPPISTINEGDLKIESQTFDSRDVTDSYANESESTKGSISIGTVVPKDMTVKLVRADTANWEIFLSVLYSLSLTFFGVFLGSWITDASKTVPTFSQLEIVATIFLGVLSAMLLSVWAFIKISRERVVY